ncbi:MAG: DUF4214 domain-containing protein [Pseudomonadota bacterium]
MDVVIGTNGADQIDVTGALRIDAQGGNDTITARQTSQVFAGEGNDAVTVLNPAPEPGTSGAGAALFNGADTLFVGNIGPEITLFTISPGVPLVDDSPDEIRLSRAALTGVAAGETREIRIEGVDVANDTVIFEDVAASEVTIGQRGSGFPETVVAFGQTEIVLTQFAFDDLSTVLSFSDGGGAVNSDPVAADDTVTVDSSLIDIDVLANDTDADGDDLEILSVMAPARGTVQFVPGVDTSVRYARETGFEGVDSFTYTISDGRGGTDTATVTLAAATTTPPVAGDGDLFRVEAQFLEAFDIDGDGPIFYRGQRMIEIATETDSFVLGDVPTQPDFTVRDLTTGQIIDFDEYDTILVTLPGPAGPQDFVFLDLFQQSPGGGAPSLDYFVTLRGGDFPLPSLNAEYQSYLLGLGADVALLSEDVPPDQQPFGGRFAEGETLAFDGIRGIELQGPGLSIGEARTVARLYEAGLDRNGNIDLPGLNFWIDQRGAGLTERALAQAFLGSAEFEAAFGDALDPGDPRFLTDRDLVQQLFRNVLDREGEQAGVDFWVGQLQTPAVTRADMLLAFAESPENIAGTPLVDTLVEDTTGDWFFS